MGSRNDMGRKSLILSIVINTLQDKKKTIHSSC